MAKKPDPIPAGYTAITPYLRIKGARDAITFYSRVFGAKVDMVMDMGDKVGHAELTIDGAKLTLADEFPEMGAVGPKTIGNTSVTIMHYCKDVDATYAKAVAAGATSKQAPADQFWGDRMASVEDPFGHVWMIMTHKEDVSDTEMQKRMQAMMSQVPAKAKPAAKVAAKKKSK